MRNKVTQGRATALRKHLTDAEQRLWRHLRHKQLQGARFRRQVPIGQYIADFVCFNPMLVIELDGGQHLAQHNYDSSRTRYLQQRGFQVLRFWNSEVLGNMGGVLTVILREIEMASAERPPP